MEYEFSYSSVVADAEVEVLVDCRIGHGHEYDTPHGPSPSGLGLEDFEILHVQVDEQEFPVCDLSKKFRSEIEARIQGPELVKIVDRAF